MNGLRKLSLVIIALMITLLIVHALWLIGRTFNYLVGYESMMKDTVTRIVKSECMK